MQALLKEAEAGLLVLLRNQLINTPRIPALLVAPAQFKDYPLTPAERYLLSRIDGIRDIRAIIRVSPIREVDALKSFVRFVEQGLISLQ